MMNCFSCWWMVATRTSKTNSRPFRSSTSRGRSTAFSTDFHPLFLQLIILSLSQLIMHRNPKTRSIKFYANTQEYTPNPKFSNNELQPYSVQQSFTEDEVDSQAEPAFETQNYVYQLQSKCHNLQYEKTKNQMAFQNLVSQLRQKNAYLEQLSSTLSQKNQALAEQRDEVRMILSEVREKNHELAKQIQGFKLEVRELESIRQENYEQGNEENLIDELQQKNEEIGQRESQIIYLQKELNRYQSNKSTYQSQSAHALKKQITSLEKQLLSVKTQLEEASKNQEIVKSLQRQKQELWKQLKLKDSLIAQNQQGKVRFQEEVERLKETFSNKEKKLTSSHNQQLKRLNEIIRFKQSQIQESQSGKVALDCKVAELTVELARTKSQNSGIDQYNKYLQSCNAENQAKRKQLQEEVYQYEKEISELRTSLFNQKLENKKLLSNIRLSFEEEKIKHMEQLDEKSKEILKIKELTISSQRQNLDFEQLNNKCLSMATESEKNEHQLGSLRSQNQKLKQDLKNLQSKYEKKCEKYSALQKQLKAEYENRITLLEGEVYRQQVEISQLQLRLESQGKTGQFKVNNPFFSHGNEEDQAADMIELLKMDIKEKKERIQQITKEKEDQCNKKDGKISKLQAEIKLLKETQMRSYFNKEDAQDKIRTIDQLQTEISRLNSEIRRERLTNDQIKRQSVLKEQKISQQLRKAHQENDSLARANKSSKEQITLLQMKTTQLQGELMSKQKEIVKLQRQYHSSKMQLQSKRISDIEQLKRNKQRQIQQCKQELKRLLETHSKQDKKADKKALKDDYIMKNYEYLVKENHQLKTDYSQALEEINSILLNYKNLQEKHKKLTIKYQEAKNELHNLKTTKVSSDYLLRQVHDYKQANESQESQIHRLNQLLMQKDRDFKKMQQKSSISPHFHNNSKQTKRTKQTQLWLNAKNQEPSYLRYKH